jgi:hypothetical protein
MRTLRWKWLQQFVISPLKAEGTLYFEKISTKRDLTDPEVEGFPK